MINQHRAHGSHFTPNYCMCCNHVTCKTHLSLSLSLSLSLCDAAAEAISHTSHDAVQHDADAAAQFKRINGGSSIIVSLRHVTQYMCRGPSTCFVPRLTCAHLCSPVPTRIVFLVSHVDRAYRYNAVATRTKLQATSPVKTTGYGLIY